MAIANIVPVHEGPTQVSSGYSEGRNLRLAMPLEGADFPNGSMDNVLEPGSWKGGDSEDGLACPPMVCSPETWALLHAVRRSGKRWSDEEMHVLKMVSLNNALILQDILDYEIRSCYMMVLERNAPGHVAQFCTDAGTLSRAMDDY